MKNKIVGLIVILTLILSACGKDKTYSAVQKEEIYTGTVPYQNRAIGGISMGAFGASNLGLKHYEMFGSFAFLGGLISMKELIKYLMLRNRPSWLAPEGINFDQWGNFPPRQTLILMLQDMTFAFGNLLYNNPNSTYYPPEYLKEPGKGYDRYNPQAKYNLIDFYDGGDKPVGVNDEGVNVTNGRIDKNENPDILTEIMLAIDYNGNGKRDRLYDYAGRVTWSEPVANHCCEPFDDSNGNMLYDEGEKFYDYGLDNVPDTNDEGEGNGEFDMTNGLKNMLENDPVSRLREIPAEQLKLRNFYFDIGDKDDFEFYYHYTTFLKAMYSKGLSVSTLKGYPYEDIFPPADPVNYLPKNKNILFEYPGHHVGGVKGIVTRFIFVLSYISKNFPDFTFKKVGKGEHGYIDIKDFISESFLPGKKSAKRYGVYLPPGYFENKDEFYPVFYFLPGYMQTLETTAEVWFRDVVDYLIYKGYLKKMIIIFPDGSGGHGGCFYVNHVDNSGHDEGQYEDYLIKDLIPYVESHYRVAR